MTNSDVISIVSLAVSVISAGITGYVVFIDRARVRARSLFYPAYIDEDGTKRSASMRVDIVNMGRRPVVLTMMGGDFRDGWSGTYMGEREKGIRLEENGKFTEDINGQHHVIWNREMDTASDLWFEDTLGRRYRVKHAKKHLEWLFNDEVQAARRERTFGTALLNVFRTAR